VVSLNRVLQILPVAVLLGILGVFVLQMYALVTAEPPPVDPIPSNSPVCRSSSPLEGVYNPWRLRVVANCITVTGRIARVARMADGDYHIDIQLDPPFANLINRRNVTRQHGALVSEVVPVDQAGIAAPHVGDHVEVTGAYVLDKLHGWMEIHPVWELKVI